MTSSILVRFPSVRSIKKSIVLTLAYSGQFAHGLSSSVLFTRLIMVNGGSQNQQYISKNAFFQALKELIFSGIVKKQKGVYQLKTVYIHTFPDTTNKKKEIAQVVSFASWIPWISAVVVTGSVAMETIKPNDDIDFLIITKPNRLWLVRPLIVLFGIFKKKRRSWYKEEPNSWCFNFWLEETQLFLPQNRWSIYTAYELCQAQFVYDLGYVEQLFLQKNKWAQKKLPTYFKTRYQQSNKTFKSKWLRSEYSLSSLFFGVFLHRFLNLLNRIAFWAQFLYMKPHKTTEEVFISAAFFHPRNTKKVLYAQWKEVLRCFTKPSCHLETLSDVFYQAKNIRNSNKSIVLVTGVFDILHSEHKAFLQAASREGDVLFVGLESDIRVKQMKGNSRPINTQLVRKKNLVHFFKSKSFFISNDVYVFILPEDFANPLVRKEVIRMIRPNILAVSEHTPHLAKKQAVLAKFGGKVRVVRKYNPEVSTTKIIQSKVRE